MDISESCICKPNFAIYWGQWFGSDTTPTTTHVMGHVSIVPTSSLLVRCHNTDTAEGGSRLDPLPLTPPLPTLPLRFGDPQLSALRLRSR